MGQQTLAHHIAKVYKATCSHHMNLLPIGAAWNATLAGLSQSPATRHLVRGGAMRSLEHWFGNV